MWILNGDVVEREHSMEGLDEEEDLYWCQLMLIPRNFTQWPLLSRRGVPGNRLREVVRSQHNRARTKSANLSPWILNMCSRASSYLPIPCKRLYEGFALCISMATASALAWHDPQDSIDSRSTNAQSSEGLHPDQ